MMRINMIALALIFGVASGLLAGSPVAYPPQTASVGVTSTMILPPTKGDYGTNQWAGSTGTNTYGDYLVVYTNNIQWRFWCVSTGTNAMATPSWSDTNDVTVGGSTFRLINPNRNAFDIQNWGDGKTSFSFGKRPAIVNSGFTIPGSGDGAVQSGYDGRPCYQGQVNAISQALFTNTLSIHEE